MINVLEGLEIIVKQLDKSYHWYGIDRIPVTVARLQVCAIPSSAVLCDWSDHSCNANPRAQAAQGAKLVCILIG